MNAIWMLLSAVAFAALFLAFPEIDLWAAGQFYSPERGFLFKGNAFFDLAKTSVEIVVVTLLLGSLFFLLPRRLGVVPAAWLSRRRAAAYILLVLLLGPGLLVNAVFKDQWGRARPSQVEPLGGELRYTPAWVVSDQCRKNCSFVCGDASVGFVLLAFAFVSRHPRRWLVIGLLAGGFYGLMRMGQGGHFLSDVIFSFYVVYFTAWLVHRFMARA